MEQNKNFLVVVIPTLNAAATLPAVLAALRPAADRLVVADGGSRDGTVELARAAGALVITGAPGRGAQLARGADAAGGDWLLFLHADSVPLGGWREAAGRFMADPANGDRAGAFTLVFDDPGPAARRVERLVAWRCRLFGLPYGDQGLLLSRRLYQAVGGFRPLPLMEDVDIVRRIGRRRIVMLDATVRTSAVRYRHGYTLRGARNLGCLALYGLGLPPRLIARLYG